MAAAKAQKKRPGRPRTGQRPVIAMRVHQELYDWICAKAGEHQFSISEEAEHQISLSREWEKTRVEMQRLTGTLGGLRELLASGGFQKLSLVKGAVWIEPGTDMSRMQRVLDVAAIVKAIEPELTDLLARAIKQVEPGS